MSISGIATTIAKDANKKLGPAPTTTLNSDSKVSNQITGLLSADNPYMKQATTRGRQQANQHGLLSSTLGIGAVENARISAALPIAQQDASLEGQASLQDSSVKQQGYLNNQQFNFATASSEQDFREQGELNTQQNEHALDLQSNDLDNNLALQRDQYGHNQRLQDSQFEDNLNLQKDQAKNTISAQNNQASNNLRLQTANNSQNIQANTNQQIASIEQNPNMSNAQKQAAITTLLNLQNAQINAMNRGQQLATTSFTYSSNS